MKLGIIFSSAMFGLFLGTSIALASMAQPAPVAPVSSVEAPEVVEPVTVAASAYTIAPTVIVVRAIKHAKPAAPKTWTCTGAHTMEQGPIGKLVKDCAWK